MAGAMSEEEAGQGAEVQAAQVNGSAETHSEEQASAGAAGGLRQGRCKWFNVTKGWGFIAALDGGDDVFVHQSVIKMSGFRSLAEDELIEFECKVSDKGLEATLVTGPNGSDCSGSQRRPVAKKRFRKFRCYNCGEFANHVAAKCTVGPQPKRCHYCKSEDHLIADCPQRPERNKKAGSSGGGGDQDVPPPSAVQGSTESDSPQADTTTPQQD